MPKTTKFCVRLVEKVFPYFAINVDAALDPNKFFYKKTVAQYRKPLKRHDNRLATHPSAILELESPFGDHSTRNHNH
jgi:hypothetical protein